MSIAIHNSIVTAPTTEGLRAQSTPATSTGSAAGAGTAISSSDFMTLLVAEMKNQDPTQPTDPTQYVQQLVQVNSLQQLISINQGVSSLKPSA